MALITSTRQDRANIAIKVDFFLAGTGRMHPENAASKNGEQSQPAENHDQLLRAGQLGGRE
jgi:hypothetical protein